MVTNHFNRSQNILTIDQPEKKTMLTKHPKRNQHILTIVDQPEKPVVTNHTKRSQNILTTGQLEKPMATNHPKRSQHILSTGQLEKPMVSFPNHPKRSQHILTTGQLEKPMVTNHPVSEKTAHRCRRVSGACSVARPTGAAVRRVGTCAPCGNRPGSHAHVLCTTRAEAGRGPVSLRKDTAAPVRGLAGVRRVRRGLICTCKTDYDEAPPARYASRVGDDHDTIYDHDHDYDCHASVLISS